MSAARHGHSRLRHQMYGVVFLLVAAVFFAGTIGIYNKVFTPYVPVTLKADKAGNQMRVGADVKVRGVLVGEVRSIGQSTEQAVLRLALKPEMTGMIPAKVSARLLPKTLFGERYVALQLPERPHSGTIAAGDVIEQDRSAASIEVEQVLNDLMPVLKSVQPQKLAVTLGAVSHAVEGRGKQMGATAVQLNDYLHKVNPSLPDMQAVLSRVDDVSHTYADAAPDLLHALEDLSGTSRTVVQQREHLDGMLRTLTTTSVDATQFLEANQQNLIDLTASSRPTLELLERYSPQYPCMLNQLAAGIPAGERAFGKGDNPPMQKVTIELTGSRGKYVPGVDEPRYEDQRGPRCYPFVEPPGAFPQYPPGGPIKDGSTKPPAPHQGAPPPFGSPPGATTPQSASPSMATNTGGSLANSPAERDLVAALTAPSLQMPPRDVPAWSALLVGPLYRGAEVTVR